MAGADISSTGVKVVSGTNVNFKASATQLMKVAGDPGTIGPPPAPYIGYSMHKIQIWIGSEFLGEFGPTIDPELARFVRFATTQFDHNTTQRIIVRAEIRVWVSDPSAYDEIIGVCYQDVKNWNKAFPIATRIGYNPNQDPSWQEDIALLEPILSNGAVSSAISGITGLKHVSDPSAVSGAQSLHIADCIPKFKTSTVFLTLTHGFPGGICDSYGIPEAGSGGQMNWTGSPSVTEYVQSSRGDIPLYNLAVIMTCNGVTMGSWSATSRPFGIYRATDPEGLSYGRCALAWGAALDAARNNVNGNHFANWYSNFLKYLGMGFTVQEAERKVWQEDNIYIYPPTGGSIRPVFLGDPKCKLIGYYDSAEGVTTWFRVVS